MCIVELYIFKLPMYFNAKLEYVCTGNKINPNSFINIQLFSTDYDEHFNMDISEI